MAAAGITGSCNPVDGSSAFMWAAAGNGSWRGLEPGERRTEALLVEAVAAPKSDKGASVQSLVSELLWICTYMYPQHSRAGVHVQALRMPHSRMAAAW